MSVSYWFDGGQVTFGPDWHYINQWTGTGFVQMEVDYFTIGGVSIGSEQYGIPEIGVYLTSSGQVYINRTKLINPMSYINQRSSPFASARKASYRFKSSASEQVTDRDGNYWQVGPAVDYNVKTTVFDIPTQSYGSYPK